MKKTSYTKLALALTIFSVANSQAQETALGAGPIPEKALAALDKDGDGKLSEEERNAGRELMKQKFEERRKEMVAKFDKDGDGKLNEEEKAAAQEARKKEILEKFDKDGDGKLSDEEKKAAGDALGRGRGGPGGPGKRPGGKGKRPGGTEEAPAGSAPAKE